MTIKHSLLSVAVLVWAISSFPQVPSGPLITGPIASTAKPGDAIRNYIFFSTAMDLQRAGYVEQEYFIEGTATRYVVPTGPGELTSPGTMPYRTRIVVRRPASAAKFNGVVVMEWQNATTGHDGDGSWATAGEFFVREGWAWVGATVQQVNVHGFPPPHPMAGTALKSWNPSRYGSLDLTNAGEVKDDSHALDVFSQIARALKQPQGANPFAGMRIQRIYATGGSQSARFLLRYYNFIQPKTELFDGFLANMGGEAPRLDQRAKMFKVYAESEVPRQAPIRVRNTASTHTWEIAGSPHMPNPGRTMDPSDPRSPAGINVRDLGPLAGIPKAECARPYPSTVENWMILTAAYAALDRWVTRNEPPAQADVIQSSGDPGAAVHTIIRDERGIARGGIRVPAIAVPTAVNTGENQPGNASPENGVCGFLGSHIPLDAATLKALYPDRSAYSREVRRIVEGLVGRRILLKEDAETLMRRAEAALPR